MDQGNLALGRGECDHAAELFARAAEIARRSGEGDWLLATKGRANALVLVGRFHEAADVYRRLVEADPSDRTSRFNLAVVLTRLRRFGQAESLYLELLAEQGDHIQARYNLASLYHAQGKLTQARDQWRLVVHQAPHLASAHAALGETLLSLGENGQAMAAFGTAAELAGSDAQMWSSLAVAAQAAGYPQQAAAAAQRAAKLADQDPAVWRLLGNALLDLHRTTGDKQPLTEAVEAWRRSLALDGAQSDLRRIVETFAIVAATTQATSRPGVDN